MGTTGNTKWRIQSRGRSDPEANSAYDLPSVEGLVQYLHAAEGFLIKSTWLAAIKTGNYATWPGLTYSDASKYYPESTETIKGHMTQLSQGV